MGDATAGSAGRRELEETPEVISVMTAGGHLVGLDLTGPESGAVLLRSMKNAVPAHRRDELVCIIVDAPDLLEGYWREVRSVFPNARLLCEDPCHAKFRMEAFFGN